MRKAGAQEVLFWLRADGYVDINLINEVGMAGKASKTMQRAWMKAGSKKELSVVYEQKDFFYSQWVWP